LNPERLTKLDPQLADDFLTEADEHLLGIRNGLLELESSVGKAQPDPVVVKELLPSSIPSKASLPWWGCHQLKH